MVRNKAFSTVFKRYGQRALSRPLFRHKFNKYILISLHNTQSPDFNSRSEGRRIIQISCATHFKIRIRVKVQRNAKPYKSPRQGSDFFFFLSPLSRMLSTQKTVPLARCWWRMPVIPAGIITRQGKSRVRGPPGLRLGKGG